MPDSESGPWESHPRRVLRRFRRKVSLYPKPVVAVSVAARYFRMVSGSLSTLCPADTVSGRWVLAYLHLAVGSRNVSDECIWNFQGSRKSYRLLTFSLPNFLRDSHTFSKNFLYRFQKTKKRPLHLFSRRSERKNKTRWFLTESHIWIYSFQKKQPRRITSARLKFNRTFFSASVVHPWCKLVYGLVYERLF